MRREQGAIGVPARPRRATSGRSRRRRRSRGMRPRRCSRDPRRSAAALEHGSHAAIERQAAEIGHHAMRVPPEVRVRAGPRTTAARTDSTSGRAHRRRPSRSSQTRYRRPIAPSARSRRTPTNGMGIGAFGTRPTLGRSATMLLKLAGLRSEPPRSLPSAIGSMPGGERRTRAAAGSAGALRRSYGIARRAVHLVVGVRAHAELRHVRLADRDRAGARIRSTSTVVLSRGMRL